MNALISICKGSNLTAPFLAEYQPVVGELYIWKGEEYFVEKDDRFVAGQYFILHNVARWVEYCRYLESIQPGLSKVSAGSVYESWESQLAF